MVKNRGRSRPKKSEVSQAQNEQAALEQALRHPKSIKVLEPRNKKQADYLKAIEDNILTVGYGPAGTGKTFIAVYQALKAHFNKAEGKKRIIISRPAVEAGEKLGFLPGTLEEKVDPYMRPIYDALYYFLGPDLTKLKIERGHIEIAPIAFLRGRTFSDAIVLLDEAQNATFEQLTMVSTRIGENCKMIINGDPFQSDLRGSTSGLSRFVEVVSNVPDVGVVGFGRGEVVRSEIVTNLVAAFEDYQNRSQD